MCGAPSAPATLIFASHRFAPQCEQKETLEHRSVGDALLTTTPLLFRRSLKFLALKLAPRSVGYQTVLHFPCYCRESLEKDGVEKNKIRNSTRPTESGGARCLPFQHSCHSLRSSQKTVCRTRWPAAFLPQTKPPRRARCKKSGNRDRYSQTFPCTYDVPAGHPYRTCCQ